MTSELEGGSQKADKSNKISWFVTVTRGREGVQKSENFADVIYGSPLRKLGNHRELRFQVGINNLPCHKLNYQREEVKGRFHDALQDGTVF